MKQFGVFIAVLFFFSVVASGLMFFAATMKPELFMLGARPAAVDSTHIRDSIQTAQKMAAAEQSESEKHLQDVKKNALPKETQKPADTAGVAEQPVIPVHQTSPEEMKSIAKMYEAMKPEDAAKILSKMNDRDIRSTLLMINKKQAAKILTSFDAARAAQILSN